MLAFAKTAITDHELPVLPQSAINGVSDQEDIFFSRVKPNFAVFHASVWVVTSYAISLDQELRVR